MRPATTSSKKNRILRKASSKMNYKLASRKEDPSIWGELRTRGIWKSKRVVLIGKVIHPFFSSRSSTKKKKKWRRHVRVSLEGGRKAR